MIYTWLQVNGVSVTDPSLSDLSDPLFLLMSASLVSFFIFFSSSRLGRSFHLSSLSWKKKKSALPGFHSRCLIFWVFFSPFLTHPHTIFTVGKHRPIQPVAYSGLRSAGWSITWFDGSYYRPSFPGQDAGIFIEADKGSSKHSHPPEADTTSHRCDLLSFFLPFREMSNTICYPHHLAAKDIQ